MADNLTTQSGTPATVPSSSVIATDDVSGVHFQRVKLVDGTLDSNVGIAGSAANGLDVDVTRVQGTVTVGDGGGTLSVDDGGGSLTVDGTVAVSGSVAVTGPLTDTQLRATAVPVSGTFYQATQPVSGSVSVSNFPASQAVTGTFWQATQPVSLAVAPAAPTDILFASPAGTTTAGVDTTIFSAVASKYIYVTSISVANTSNTTTLITFYEDTYATQVVYRTIAPALGGSNITFPTPLRLDTVNKLFGYRHETTVAGGSVYVSAVGYAGA